jgi:hypothetical protein
MTTSVVDEEAIDHESHVGIVHLSDESILVRVAQRVDFDLLADPIVMHRSPPRITLGAYYELNSGQARSTAGYLMSAADLADKVSEARWGWRPHLVPRR